MRCVLAEWAVNSIDKLWCARYGILVHAETQLIIVRTFVGGDIQGQG